MKKIVLALGLFLLGTTIANAQENKFTIGADLIESNLSSQLYLSQKQALRADVGFLFLDANAVNLNISFLFYKTKNSLSVRSGRFIPYHGPGILLDFAEDNDPSFGINFPIGFQYTFEDAPVEVFMDLGPYLYVEPIQLFGLRSSFGLRYKL